MIFTSEKRKIFLYGLMLISFAFIGYPFFHTIMLSLITAVVSYRFFSFLKKKTKKTWISLSLVWILIFVIFLGSAFTITVLLKKQQKLVLQNRKSLDNKISLLQKYIPANKFFVARSLGVKALAPVAGVKGYTALAEEKISQFLLGKIKSIPKLILSGTLYLFLVSSFLLYADRLIAVLRKIIPLEEGVIGIFLKKIYTMIRGVFFGGVVVALIQAGATTLAFALVGFSYLGAIFLMSFFLFFLLIGSVIFYVPMTLYLLAQGNFIAAFFFLIGNFLIANIDNLLRPVFLDKEVRIDMTLMLLGILSSVSLVGVLGVFYGPIIVLVGLVSLELYESK